MAPKRPLSHKKFLSLFPTLLLCSVLLMSCGLPTSLLPAASTARPPTPSPWLGGFASPTAMPPSPTPQQLLATPDESTQNPVSGITVEAATVAQPSSTPQETATPTVPAGSFSLAPGTTAGALTGSLDAGQVVSFTLGAAQSQPLTLLVDSPKHDVTLGVSDPSENVLLNPSSKQTSWQAVLPATGLYTIKVIGGAAKETYSLTVKTPQPVNLASDANSVTLAGKTLNGILYSYALSLSAGQTVSVNLSAPSGEAGIDIYGLSTGTILSATAAASTWTGVLPQTQVYVVEVFPTHSQEVDYSLSLSVGGAAASTSATAAPSGTGGNISFLPGMTAAVLQGTIQAGQIMTYTVQAGKAQPLILLVQSPDTDVTLGVLMPDGGRLFDPANKWSYVQWQLPKTGLYTIQVIGGKTSEKYTLTVKLPKLVYFAGEPRSVTLKGNTFPGLVVSYAFRLGAGSHLTVNLDTPSGLALITIFGVETGSLVKFTDSTNSFSGNLPATDEYVIEVAPYHGASTTYTLTVSIP